MSGPTPQPAPTAALVAEAARKSRVCWLDYDHDGGVVRQRLVWHAWHDGALVVVSWGEQVLEGAGSARSARVTLRAKDSRAHLVTCPVDLAVVDPSSAAWDEHTGALLGVRLNLTDPGAAREAWRREATVLRLTPVPPESAPGALP